MKYLAKKIIFSLNPVPVWSVHRGERRQWTYKKLDKKILRGKKLVLVRGLRSKKSSLATTKPIKYDEALGLTLVLNIKRKTSISCIDSSCKEDKLFYFKKNNTILFKLYTYYFVLKRATKPILTNLSRYLGRLCCIH